MYACNAIYLHTQTSTHLCTPTQTPTNTRVYVTRNCSGTNAFLGHKFPCFFLKYQELRCGFLELCSLSVRPNHGVCYYKLLIALLARYKYSESLEQQLYRTPWTTENSAMCRRYSTSHRCSTKSADVNKGIVLHSQDFLPDHYAVS